MLKRVENYEKGKDEDEALLPLTPETVSSAPTDERKQAQLLQLLLRPASWLWSAGIPCCLTSAFLLSINATLVKSLRELSIFEVALVRSVFGIVLTLSLMHANNVRSLCVDPRNLPTLLGLGLIGSTAVLLSWVGLQNIPLADAQTVFSLYPAATALMAYLILGERLGVLQVVGVLASVAGVVIIAQPPILLGERFAWEVGRGFTIMCLVAAALMSATSITIIRKLGNTEHSLVTSMWFHLTALSICVPALAVGWPKFPEWELSSLDWARLLGIGLTGFSAQLLVNRGIQLTSGATSASISSMQVPLAYIWGIVIFGEIPTLLGTAGSVVVIFGLVAVNIGAKRPGWSSEAAGSSVDLIKQEGTFEAKKKAAMQWSNSGVGTGDVVDFVMSYAHVAADEENVLGDDQAGLIRAFCGFESSRGAGVKHAAARTATIQLTV